jgi:pimeloyl-ACP methyl ester carboxylesterase
VVGADGCGANGGLKKVAVTERAVRLGPAGLFGIETEPDTGSEGPTCVFFSVANEHRIGPGRLWVRLSRELACEGFRSVRVDVNGFGDSSPPGGEPEPPVHSAQAIDDVLESARAVSPADPSEVVLFGLCSSGYQILEAALSLAPQGVCALNPALVFEPPEIALAGRMDVRRRFCLPESGLVNAASERQPLQWLRRRFPTLMSKARRTARLLALRMRRAVGLLKNRPGERLGDLVGAGTDVFLICGPQEIEPLFETGLSQERRTVRSDRLQIEVLPSLQHSLLSVRDRDAVTRLVLEHVREHFQGFPHDAGAQAVARPDGR